MSEWKKVKFLDVVSLNPRVSLEKGAVYPFVEMSNAVPGARKPEKDVYQKYSGGGAKFEEGDTVVARIEPCLQNGKGFQCSYKKGFGSTEFLVFRPLNLKEMDCDFLYYYMGQKSIREAMAKTMVGASGRQRVNNAVFNDLQINLPPLNIQQEIASILSRYDTLIENYQKQIKLLEEAAQRFYKEWFVELRFPGHENTKMVDGLPEGWEFCRIGDKYKTVLGGTPSRANLNYWGGNIPWINSGEINKLRIVCASEMITMEGFENSSTKLMPIHTTILAITGATLGQVSYTEIETCANQSVVGIIDETKLTNEYLYLNISNNILSIVNKATGGAQQHINKDIVNDYPIMIPSSFIVALFKNKVAPIFDLIKNYLYSIESLTEARDRLLPRLIGGEMEVKTINNKSHDYNND